MSLVCHTSHSICMYSYVIRIPFICTCMSFLYHSCLICMSLVCISMSLACHSYVLVCLSCFTSISFVCHLYDTRNYSYVTRMHLYVICMSLVCTPMLLVCVFTMNIYVNQRKTILAGAFFKEFYSKRI